MRALPPHVLTMLAALLTGLTLAGCSTAPKEEPYDPQTSAATQLPQRTPETEASRIPLEPTKPAYAGPWEDPSSPLYNRTIYFDYDSAEIKPESLPVLRTHARYLGSNTGTKVTLEGHTDERGTREYNLALSDQRTDAVRRFMLAEGSVPDQMATLAYGEERPADPGHGEQAWRQNRRVIIQY